MAPHNLTELFRLAASLFSELKTEKKLEGKLEAKLEVANQMKELGSDIEFISKVSGLSKEELKKHGIG